MLTERIFMPSNYVTYNPFCHLVTRAEFPIWAEFPKFPDNVIVHAMFFQHKNILCVIDLLFEDWIYVE